MYNVQKTYELHKNGRGILFFVKKSNTLYNELGATNKILSMNPFDILMLGEAFTTS